MTIPDNTFIFEGSDYLIYPEDPWLQLKMTPNDWFKRNVYKFLYAAEHIIKEAVPYENDEGPWSSGIYFLLKNDEIMYVGLSQIIRKRLNEHSTKGWEFNRYWCFGGVPKFFIENVEAFYIDVLQPPRNIKYTSISGITLDLVNQAKAGTLEYV